MIASFSAHSKGTTLCKITRFDSLLAQIESSDALLDVCLSVATNEKKKSAYIHQNASYRLCEQTHARCRIDTSYPGLGLYESSFLLLEYSIEYLIEY